MAELSAKRKALFAVVLVSIGVRVIDRPAKELTGVGTLFANHIHLNPAGSARLAELLADELTPVLREGPQAGEER